jgi:hypothetical protein
MNHLAPLPSAAPPLPVLVAAAGGHAKTRFLEFFAANIHNKHTRRAGVVRVTARRLRMAQRAQTQAATRAGCFWLESRAGIPESGTF